MPDAAAGARRAWAWLTHTLAGRLILLGGVAKLVSRGLRVVPAVSFGGTIDTVGSLCLVVAAFIVGYRGYLLVKRAVLWRVRRKLTLSYVFIGFVPAILLMVFFSICGLLLVFDIGAYMLRSHVATFVERTQFLAQTAAVDLGRARDAGDVVATLARQQASAAARFPAASLALVPPSAACGGPAGAAVAAAPPAPRAGPWSHGPPPAVVPEWLPCTGFAGLVTGATGNTAWVAARAVAWFERGGRREAVVVDVPLDEAFLTRLRDETGVDVRAVRRFEQARGVSTGTAGAAAARAAALQPRNLILAPVDPPLGVYWGTLRWVAFLDYTAWDTGRADSLFADFGLGLRAVYDRVSASPVARLTDFSFAQLLLVGLAVVAALFLIIVTVAFLMGITLARSITGAVHELFEGTERVRSGDLTHKILVRSRDQLGELAESFNSMTSSIEDLLVQKAHKERLQQELQVARDIQMSLLPQGALTFAGLTFSGHCEPAREVGGDYYDFWAIDEGRFGMLIADVAGKGASAALYMAELKGIVQSFSQSHVSPRQLLINANRIISRHLSSSSFITMTYGVVDVAARTLTYARAGHCPLIRLPGPGSPSRAAEVLAPDGLVLGLKIDDGQTFERLLVEATIPLAAGDVFLLYTDGLTEAMNAGGDFFGEERLSALLQTQGNAPFPEVRDSILGAVAAFAGAAERQDDMTMLLLQVGSLDGAAL